MPGSRGARAPGCLCLAARLRRGARPSTSARHPSAHLPYGSLESPIVPAVRHPLEMRRILVPPALAAVAVVALGAGSATTATRLGGDWTRFGYDAARSSSGPAQTGITAANLGKLRRSQTQLGGT